MCNSVTQSWSSAMKLKCIDVLTAGIILRMRPANETLHCNVASHWLGAFIHKWIPVTRGKVHHYGSFVSKYVIEIAKLNWWNVLLDHHSSGHSNHCGWTPFYFTYDPKCSTTFPWCTINAPVAFACCTINALAAFAWCMNHLVYKVDFSYIG